MLGDKKLCPSFLLSIAMRNFLALIIIIFRGNLRVANFRVLAKKTIPAYLSSRLFEVCVNARFFQKVD
ncbi:hypothetical protein DW203_03180 [Citrobacter portucalensis]|nr:hypothetical protein DW203_03180 [Citrobacter portucalensis]TKU08105.1 hypothetical protein FDW96_10740 [Citrobacter sp. TBCS-15]TKU52219.1 hypothetical protein FDX11_01765 [Citrobacter sp. wls714]TKU68306.1 hypothetical protein FDX14_23655 [Citrobacter sp. wls710]TKU75111.1 hypothetical protein FDW92_10805 [Citrobacter sp. wls706]